MKNDNIYLHIRTYVHTYLPIFWQRWTQTNSGPSMANPDAWKYARLQEQGPRFFESSGLSGCSSFSHHFTWEPALFAATGPFAKGTIRGAWGRVANTPSPEATPTFSCLLSLFPCFQDQSPWWFWGGDSLGWLFWKVLGLHMASIFFKRTCNTGIFQASFGSCHMSGNRHHIGISCLCQAMSGSDCLWKMMESPYNVIPMSISIPLTSGRRVETLFHELAALWGLMCMKSWIETEVILSPADQIYIKLDPPNLGFNL